MWFVEENEDTCCPHCGSKNIKSHEFHKKERIHAGSFNETPVYFNFSHHRLESRKFYNNFIKKDNTPN